MMRRLFSLAIFCMLAAGSFSCRPHKGGKWTLQIEKTNIAGHAVSVDELVSVLNTGAFPCSLRVVEEKTEP